MLAESAVDDALPKVVCPLTVRVEAVVVAKEEVPVTKSAPLEVNDEVAVIDPKVADPPVSVEMVAVIAFRRVAKKLEEVALVLVKLVTTPVVEKRLVIVPAVAEAVLRTV